jgi:hypothetical protein
MHLLENGWLTLTKKTFDPFHVSISYDATPDLTGIRNNGDVFL